MYEYVGSSEWSQRIMKVLYHHLRVFTFAYDNVWYFLQASIFSALEIQYKNHFVCFK